MAFPVIRGVAYCLVHAPDMLLHYGTTPSAERRSNPRSAYLKQLPGYLRDYESTLNYGPNQVFLGRFTPEVLKELPRPWHQHLLLKQDRFGPYGEIMPEPEFIGLMKLVDTSDLVQLEEGFSQEIAYRLADDLLFSGVKLPDGKPSVELLARVGRHEALPLHVAGRVAGIVRRAHDTDESQSAHAMLENLVTKASAVLALKHLVNRNHIRPHEVEYIIECSEAVNRCGGSSAKAIGEACGCMNASGSETRAYCAAPVHALIEGAGLIQAGVYQHVVVVAGGTPAILGQNSRDHVSRGVTPVEDVIGAFAIHLSQDDFVSPRIRLDMCGRHKAGSGFSPRAVMESLVAEPLDRAGLKITDIGKYGAELQNPECMEPAGAGAVPESDWRLIGALAVERGELSPAELEAFADRHGFPGFAPTQGHIAAGVPAIGPVKEMIAQGMVHRAMIIDRGTLGPGRMASPVDGVSFVMEKNPGKPVGWGP
ncbi:MAG TPA: glycine/sarcosine/betaine reductase complex component C subunit beta [Symbiobacteriaceae bacterium]|nr:glycine/sarcosine/betaine reductase complex component C subunit beta [Symbiobacteriaceae bacterium]